MTLRYIITKLAREVDDISAGRDKKDRQMVIQQYLLMAYTIGRDYEVSQPKENKTEQTIEAFDYLHRTKKPSHEKSETDPIKERSNKALYSLTVEND